jgi:hypothetical protein
MRLLELPTYIALGAIITGMFLVVGTNVYGIYQLSQSGRHWDLWNGYGTCPTSGFFDLSQIGCVFSDIANTTLRYIPPRVIIYLGLVFTGFGAIAMFLGDQSERVPIETGDKS